MPKSLIRLPGFSARYKNPRRKAGVYLLRVHAELNGRI